MALALRDDAHDDAHDVYVLVEVEALEQDDDVHDDVVLAVEALVPACD